MLSKFDSQLMKVTFKLNDQYVDISHFFNFKAIPSIVFTIHVYLVKK